jgi:DUF971 family protein
MTTGKKDARAEPWPESLHYNPDQKTLSVKFDSGEAHVLPAAYLRVESPSAEVQGHGNDEKRIVARRKHVGITHIEPVGNYAVRLVFDDMHDTGIYSWRYLLELGREHGERWEKYLDALNARGLQREP